MPLPEGVSIVAILLQAEVQAAHALWRLRAQQQVEAEQPAPQARQVQHLLLVACLAKAAEAVAVGLPEMAAQAVQVVVAQVVVVAELVAARMLRVPGVLVVLAGRWFWSFDHGQIRCC